MSRLCLIALSVALLAASSVAQGPAPATAPTTAPTDVGQMLLDAQKSVGPSGTVQALVAVTVLAVAPALAVMVTCFTRIIVVLGLLRQALGTQQLPPNQVLFGLALFMTLVVMAPVFQNVHRDAIAPYSRGAMTAGEAWNAGKTHLRGFMIRQVEAAGNAEDVHLFLDEKLAQRPDLTWRDVGTEALIPGFVVSELKTAFLIGFRIYLPFLIVDMLVASVLLSMGMLMLPPVLVSLPFKLLLFVLADGWHLVVGTLMQSFA